MMRESAIQKDWFAVFKVSPVRYQTVPFLFGYIAAVLYDLPCSGFILDITATIR